MTINNIGKKATSLPSSAHVQSIEILRSPKSVQKRRNVNLKIIPQIGNKPGLNQINQLF